MQDLISLPLLLKDILALEKDAMTFKSQITLLFGKLRRKLEKCIEITDLIYKSAKHTESEIC